jgi:hypothetical protein
VPQAAARRLLAVNPEMPAHMAGCHVTGIHVRDATRGDLDAITPVAVATGVVAGPIPPT